MVTTNKPPPDGFATDCYGTPAGSLFCAIIRELEAKGRMETELEMILEGLKRAQEVMDGLNRDKNDPDCEPYFVMGYSRSAINEAIKSLNSLLGK